MPGGPSKQHGRPGGDPAAGVWVELRVCVCVYVCVRILAIVLQVCEVVCDVGDCGVIVLG